MNRNIAYRGFDLTLCQMNILLKLVKHCEN